MSPPPPLQSVRGSSQWGREQASDAAPSRSGTVVGPDDGEKNPHGHNVSFEPKNFLNGLIIFRELPYEAGEDCISQECISSKSCRILVVIRAMEPPGLELLIYHFYIEFEMDLH